MGLFNEHSSTTKTDSSSTQGIPGPQGIGYKLDANGNFDIENKKLTNVKNGDENNDVMNKSQIESYVSNKTIYLKNVNPGQVINNKAVIYSNTGSVHSNALYLKDRYGQETILHNEDQDDNQIRLYIPNLKNNDSFGGRLKSSIVITSISQTIEGKKIFHDIEVPTPTINGHASNKAYVDNEISKISDASDNSNYVKKSGDTMLGSLIVPKDNYPVQGDLNKVISYETQREIFLSKREGGKMLQPIDMNGFTIDNLPLPTANDHACNKGYVDNKVNSKADRSDLDDYLKLDGSKSMTGNLNMDNNRITNLPSPYFSHEAVTKDYVTTVMNHLPSLFLDRQGKSSMLGNLNMNNHLIQNVKDPDNTDDCANKKYVDSQISKANIKPSHTPKNAFKYLMDDVNEWSSEYNIKVLSFSDLAESPHSWDKRVLNITPVKDGKNYRFRLGLQMFPMKTNETYSLIVELYNRDFKTWGRQETYVNGTGLWVKSSNTTKFQHRYGSSGDLYYTKTLIKFKKTSSSAPIFVYFTVHFDDNGGDMNTYPKDFKNQVYIISYGIVGETDHVDSEVYDAHEAFEIEKTKMKMLVPLDMNGKQLMNVNLDLKFGNIFKIENCFIHDNHPSSQLLYNILRKRNNNTLVPFIISVPVVLVSFNLPSAFNIKLYDKAFIEIGERITNKITIIALKNLNTILLQIYKNGIKHIHFYNIRSSQFDLDVILSYM